MWPPAGPQDGVCGLRIQVFPKTEFLTVLWYGLSAGPKDGVSEHIPFFGVSK